MHAALGSMRSTILITPRLLLALPDRVSLCERYRSRWHRRDAIRCQPRSLRTPFGIKRLQNNSNSQRSITDSGDRRLASCRQVDGRRGSCGSGSKPHSSAISVSDTEDPQAAGVRSPLAGAEHSCVACVRWPPETSERSGWDCIRSLLPTPRGSDRFPDSACVLLHASSRTAAGRPVLMRQIEARLLLQE